MKPEHRGILAVALSTLVLLFWFGFVNPPQPPAQKPAGTASTPTEAAQTSAGATSAVAAKAAAPYTASKDPQANIAVQTEKVANNLYEATLSNDGAVITSWKILKYQESTDKTSPFVDLVDSNVAQNQASKLSFVDANFHYPQSPRFRLVSANEHELKYLWRSKEIEVVKTYVFQSDRYSFDVKVDITNKTNRVLQERAQLDWSGSSTSAGGGGFLSFLKQPPLNNQNPVYYIDGEVEREQNVAAMSQAMEKGGSLYWAGLESRYFLTAILPRVQSAGNTARYSTANLPALGEGGKAVTGGVALASTSINPGQTAHHVFTVYAGPKEIDQLKPTGSRLEEAIDLGWFAFLAIPIVHMLNLFYMLLQNYGVAIILLTMFIKLLLHPISKKSMKSMKAMQQLQPRLKKLQEKYKDDKARLNKETMQLFKTHGANPAGGCLPMLLQFPVYIALYRVLWNSIELYHAPFFWFYKDLAAPDPYYITPVLLGLFMVLQQKLMPSASADPAQKKMMMIMPVMFAGFMLFLPMGLVLYILVNTVTSVAQQYLYNNDIRLRDAIRGKFPKDMKFS